jgi:general nucleoside transport system permease protein
VRLRFSSARSLLVPLAAVTSAILVLNLLSWGFGGAPLSTLLTAIGGSWGTPYGIGQVLYKATPLLLAGIAVDLALRAGMFNIGVEGQIAIGSLLATVVAIYVPAWMPSFAAVFLVLCFAGMGGALWAAVPGLMRARLGVHEVITTIMLNRVADALVALIMTSLLILPGTTRTQDVAPSTHLLRLDAVFPSLAGSAVSLSIVLALVALVVVFWWLKRARVGREIVWVGLNESACAAEGIPVASRRVLAMMLSGGIAAMAVSATVLGYKGYFEIGLGAGVGFGGIAVAFLGRGHPVGLLLAALLFGTLQQAGLAINAQVPREAMGMLEAVVIVAVALADRAWRKQAPLAGDGVDA